MNKWFRLYNEILDDPKIRKLSDRQFRHWIRMLAIASRQDGVFTLEDVRHYSNTRSDHARGVASDLCSTGLIEDRGDFYTPHNWDGRQFKSDVSTQRVREHRKQLKVVSGNTQCNVSETPPDIQSTDTERKKDKNTPSGSTASYAWQYETIKLTEKDLNRWQLSFPEINVRAELEGMAGWLIQQTNWFHAAAGALAKKNREIGERRRERVAAPKSKYHSV